MSFSGSGGTISISSPGMALTTLGKPTMRGIRKCPKCGTYNGTRGLSCKNKTCDMVFKEADKSKKSSCDAVRLYTGDNGSLFSVRNDVTLISNFGNTMSRPVNTLTLK